MLSPYNPFWSEVGRVGRVGSMYMYIGGLLFINKSYELR